MEDDPSQTNILFKDIEYFSIDKKYYNLRVDKKSEITLLFAPTLMSVEKTKDENLGLLNTLNDVIVSINRFISIINIISQEYYKNNSDRLEFGNAISTFLNEINIPSDDKIHNLVEKIEYWKRNKNFRGKIKYLIPKLGPKKCPFNE